MLNHNSSCEMPSTIILTEIMVSFILPKKSIDCKFIIISIFIDSLLNLQIIKN
jgi:hypothetical protein